MSISMLLGDVYESSGWFRILFIIVGVIALVGISENVKVTFWLFAYCVLQRTALSLLTLYFPGMPKYLFMVGLAIEIILALVVIIMDLNNGPICILRGAIFCYETWLISNLLTGITYGIIVGMQSSGFTILIVLIILICVIT